MLKTYIQSGTVALAIASLGVLYSCSKSSDNVSPDASKVGTTSNGKLSAQKDPTGQFVDKSVQVVGYEDGRERPTRFKADKNPSKLVGGTSNLLIPTDPDIGGGYTSNASVGPYLFVSSVGQGMDTGLYDPNYNPNRYILDVEIAKGGDASAGAPFGYTKLNLDLNSGAGGKYIYLCFSRFEVTDRTECLFMHMRTPLTSITADDWSTFSISSPPKDHCAVLTREGTVFPWTFKTAELNDGAGGRYIYAYESKRGTASPIREVGVVAGDNSGIQPPAGWVRTGVDLNKGAGGDYIYLCYKR